jgi:NADH:ubiquinone reductase (H+-translocating)
MNQQIVIVGGGFAGVKCARTLRKLLPNDSHRIVLFNRENHMVFHPLLAEVVSAAVQPKDVGAPLRQLLNGVQCRSEEVTSIDLEKAQLHHESHDGTIRAINFDHLVLCCGNSVNLSLVPGMDEHAFPLKTIGDAFVLQTQIMEQLEKAEVCEDADRKRWYLTFVIVGGGFSGVEVAGEINDLVRDSTRFFQNIRVNDIKVVIVHSRDELLPEVSPSLRKFTKSKMEEAGVEILLNAKAKVATPEGLQLENGTFLKAGTVICTIGTTAQHLIDRLNLPKQAGRLKTAPDMSLPGFSNVWAVGDCAAVINSLDGTLSPTVAQFAERQGAQVAQNIVARIKGKPTVPFHHKMQGQLCAIGGHSAVAEILGIHISGFIAWFLWRGIYLMKLPSFAQKVQVGLEWIFDLLFPRTLAHLKADRSKRISRAYYRANDFVFRRGEPATEFYVIEKGEVEVLEHVNDDATQTIAVLVAGDFFGESALLKSTVRHHSVRARTELVCILLGRNVFAQVSSALTPLHDAIAIAARKRTSMWHDVPEVRQMLESLAVESMLEPLPMEPAAISSSVEAVIDNMDKNSADSCCIVDSDGFLVGIITRSDLLRALEKEALADPDVDLPVTEIMVPDPICMSLNDPLAVAVATMREHDLKQIPVVENSRKRVLKGRIRIEKIVQHVLTEMFNRRKKQSIIV